MKKTIWICLALGALLLSACASLTATPGSATSPAATPGGATSAAVTPGGATGPAPTLPAGTTELTIVTHDSFAVSEDVLAEFETANHARVQILKSGDAGAALNKVILGGASNPPGDAFFGVDNTFLSRALKADLFAPYKPAGADTIPDAFRGDPDFRLTPIDYGDVCLNYDTAWFQSHNVPPPASLDDLAKPAYKDLLVVENPATSSPGLAFLLATVSTYGENGYLDYWQKLRANGAAVSEGWEDAYYTRSTWSGKGERPIVVSYATSPAAEVFFSGGKLDTPPTGNVLGKGSCFRQVEFAGVFQHAKQPELARRFLDFMLSPRFQADIPLQMFVYPVLPNTPLPDVFKFAERPTDPAPVTPAAIDANRDAWIKAWTAVMLR